MSNALAIATVTAALKERLEEAVTHAVGGATVHTGRPDSKIVEEDAPKTGLFLYQVRPNPAIRNNWQPVRGTGGRLLETPRVAVDLYYLISFYGNAEKLHPELMAAEVVRTLETTPILTRELLEKTIAENDEISDSDLHEAVETVKATPIAMDLEELSKLWSIFFQVPYALSLPYLCSYVVVEAEQQGGPVLPVTRPVIAPMPVSKVTVHVVEAVAGPRAPIVWGGALRIRGRGLAKPGLRILLDGTDVELAEATSKPEEVVFDLVAASFGGTELAAGVHRVQVVDPPPPGTPAHLVRTSDVVPFKLRSTLAIAATTANEIRVGFQPEIVEGQTVRLFLEELVDDGPKSYVLIPEPIPAADFPKAELEFPLADVDSGTYLVSAQVDGVYSALDVGEDPDQPDFGQIKGPQVVIP